MSGSDIQVSACNGLTVSFRGQKLKVSLSPSTLPRLRSHYGVHYGPGTLKCDIWFLKHSVSLANGEKLVGSC